jgi:hypothetical protein
LWDGKQSEEIGSTAQVVRFHHDDVMAGLASTESMDRQLLVDDESDLVYHIVVSRDRPDGAPSGDFVPLQSSWLTKDDETPRTGHLPGRYAQLFDRTSEFNRELRRYSSRIASECVPLTKKNTDESVPKSARRIDRLFCFADWLAIHYQNRVMWTSRITHGLALIMGISFILYSEFEARDLFIEIFFTCFIIAFVLTTIVRRRDWHGKYLEYRTLAEGLRVQFYWAVAGVTGETSTKYSHDSYLQKQDPELAWIRNVMRVAGIGCDVAPNLVPAGLSYAINEWIGTNESGGQLGYYGQRASAFATRAARLSSLAQIAGITATALVILSALVASDQLRSLLFLILAALLLFYSVQQSLAYRTAETDLLKQYQFMHSMFVNARKHLQYAPDDGVRRKILRVLGQSALDEHAAWISLHRERFHDPADVLRMEP